MTFLCSIPHGSTLYIDLEGENLCRHGTISLVIVLVHPHNITRIIDISTLGVSAFNTSSGDGRTLKFILEDPNMPKCVWDVRNDADALCAHYRVGLAGVIDIQLLENASRPTHRNKTRLSGLDNAIRYDLNMGFADRQRWLQTKQEVRGLMSTGIFTKRPLGAKMIQYYINDVEKLPELHAVYMRKITPPWLAKAREETEKRLAEARSPGYQPQSPDKTFGPGRSQSGSRISLWDAIETMREDGL